MDICPSGRCLLAAATAAVVVIISAAAEKNDDKDYNPETVVVAEATVVTKAAHIYTSFLSIIVAAAPLCQSQQQSLSERLLLQLSEPQQQHKMIKMRMIHKQLSPPQPFENINLHLLFRVQYIIRENKKSVTILKIFFKLYINFRCMCLQNIPFCDIIEYICFYEGTDKK